MSTLATLNLTSKEYPPQPTYFQIPVTTTEKWGDNADLVQNSEVGSWGKPPRCHHPVDALQTTFPEASWKHGDMGSYNAQKKGFRCSAN